MTWEGLITRASKLEVRMIETSKIDNLIFN